MRLVQQMMPVMGDDQIIQPQTSPSTIPATEYMPFCCKMYMILNVHDIKYEHIFKYWKVIYK